MLVEADTSCEETAAEDEETVGQDTAEHRGPDDAELSLDEGKDRYVWEATLAGSQATGQRRGLTDDQFDSVSV